MFRWGILSTAKIGRDHLLPAIAESQSGVLSGIASRSKDRAQDVANRFGIPHVFDSYEALLESSDIDGVYIPLPTSQHVEWSEKAARAGKHVLCEKPIALHADQINQLIATRDETGCLISEAFMVTYHPQWQMVRQLIADRKIGELRQINGIFTYFNRDPSNMRNQPNLGGGGLPDIGVYPTVTSRFATGLEPKRIRAEVEFSHQFGTDKFANVTLDFGNFSMNFYCSTQLALHQEMSFHGSKGRIALPAPFNAGLFEFAAVEHFDNETQSITRHKFSGVQQYALQIDAFVAAVKDRSKPHFSLEDSKANQAVIDAIYAAGRSGDWVTL